MNHLCNQICGAIAGIVDNSYTPTALSPTLSRVHWDRVFEDLESQLAAEWEAERAVLDAESERLRIAKLTLRTRLRMLGQRECTLSLRLLTDGARRNVRLRAVGADWIATQGADPSSTLIIPLSAITSLETDHGALLGTLEDSAPSDTLRDRMTLGFLLRDLARRRISLRLALRDGETLHGTIDRAGADHLDLAVHDSGQSRRVAAVRAFRMVPFDALVWLHPGGAVI